MNKDNMLSNLTIVLCVYGRSEFSERFLKYMDKIGYYFPILVADGDDSPQLKNLIQQHKELDIKLVTFKQKEKYKDYYSMIVNALREVTTEYSMLADNDDFVVKTGLNKLLHFLDNNPDYSASRGDVFDFAINSLNKKNQLYGDIYSIFRLFYPIGYNSNDVLERLKDYKKCYSGLWHSIIRTEVLKEIINRSIKNNISSNQIFERYVNLMILISGKVYFDNSF